MFQQDPLNHFTDEMFLLRIQPFYRLKLEESRASWKKVRDFVDDKKIG